MTFAVGERVADRQRGEAIRGTSAAPIGPRPCPALVRDFRPLTCLRAAEWLTFATGSVDPNTSQDGAVGASLGARSIPFVIQGPRRVRGR
ncbi:MAG TPA: hypothetical protein VFO79_06450, partial [Xanthomonadales bacterium]|nr:hypothetical protein [Xanthomonadales bacterium]